MRQFPTAEHANCFHGNLLTQLAFGRVDRKDSVTLALRQPAPAEHLSRHRTRAPRRIEWHYHPSLSGRRGQSPRPSRSRASQQRHPHNRCRV